MTGDTPDDASSLLTGRHPQPVRIGGASSISTRAPSASPCALSTYEPIPAAERFGIEYWALEEAKLRRLPTPKPLTGRVALVTGVASGIGRSIAERLAAEGAAVVLADLDVEHAAGVAAGVGGDDVARVIQADVTNEEDVVRALDEACLAFGGADLIVNNAGLSLSRSLVETSVADWTARTM